jgi:hypothetical protein
MVSDGSHINVVERSFFPGLWWKEEKPERGVETRSAQKSRVLDGGLSPSQFAPQPDDDPSYIRNPAKSVALMDGTEDIRRPRDESA